MNRFTHYIAAAACLLAAHAGAADWYVAPTGNDKAASNTLATPYKTLAKAATVVNPGDTVWIMTGTYAPVKLTRSGTGDSARVTWKAYPGNTPEIVSTGWNAIDVQASWQTIDGLTLTGNNDNVKLADAEADYNNATANPLYNGNGINLDNRSLAVKVFGLTVRNCVVRKFGGGGIAANQSDFTVIENNVVYENAWYARYGNSGITILPANAPGTAAGPGYRNIIRGNVLFNNRGLVMWKAVGRYSDGNGFILDTVAADYTGRTLVSDNLTVNNGGSGIHAYKGRNADIVNNTAYMNGDKVGYADIYAQDSVDIKLYNNVVYSRPGGKANTNTRNTAVVYDYNIYYNGTTEVRGAHDVVADPLFVKAGLDPRTSSFELKGNSPAINTGVSIAGVTSTRDLLGNSRAQRAGIDRGAYELQAPRIVSADSASGAAGAPFSYSIVALNSPTSYAATGLPAGLTLDTATGVISGTPLAAGETDAQIKAISNVGSYATGLHISVAAASGARRALAGAPRDSAGLYSGDASLTVRLATASQPAGIVLQSAVDGNAYAALLADEAGVRFERVDAAAAKRTTAGVRAAGPVWLRLVRKGDLLSAYVSTDGAEWRLLRSEQVSLGQVVKAGLQGAEANASNISVSKGE